MEPDSLAPNRQHLWPKGDEILKALGFSETLHIAIPNNSPEPPRNYKHCRNTTSGLAFQETMTFPWQEQRGENLHPFTIALLASFVCAIVAWSVTKWLIWLSRKG